ncbi:DUF6069 family protein [Halovivax gelatinilyticus]|uniref:DUF6069 family protein n=1 Tax=Halovivax gelatinilyticus TaxID=2961597 RepID=UPI0020CA8CF3|nr:DUF6069 family protein [Halovivax gelatinilyticus]
MASRFDAAGESIPTATLAVRGVVALILSILGNGALLGIVLATDVVSRFDALSPIPVFFLTIVGVIGATVVFGALTRRSDRPDRTFTLVAAVVLLASFAPDLYILSEDPDATAGAVAVLMVMHVVVAAACVFALTDRYSPIAR